jgi:hypothetical protein
MIKINEKTNDSDFDFPYFGSGNGHRYNGCKINILFTNKPTQEQIITIIELAPEPIKPSMDSFIGKMMLADGGHVSYHIHDTYGEKRSNNIENQQALDTFEVHVENWFLAINKFCPITLVYRVENRRAYGKHSLWHQKSIDIIPQLIASWTKTQEVFKLTNVEKQWFIIVLKGIFEFGNTNLESLPSPFFDLFFSVYEVTKSLIEENNLGQLISDVKSKLNSKKTITGKVYEVKRLSPNYDRDQIIEYKKEVKAYKIFLLVSEIDPFSKTLKFEFKETGFEIVLAEDQLEKYNYLGFESDGYKKIIEINAISERPVHIILECNTGIAKPAIYLYPETTQEIIVEHIFKGKILNTYPKYDKNWKVIASPNGVLLNIADNIKYNYLFWDGTYSFPRSHYDYKTGFYVEAEKTIGFLQEKLSNVGLNQIEINDFIVYWLPELSKSNINFIHFWINDNIDNSSVLNITPNPQTSIRLFMEFKKHTQNNKKLPEQKLPSFKRKGFTMVEWGGANIESNKMK